MVWWRFSECSARRGVLVVLLKWLGGSVFLALVERVIDFVVGVFIIL